MYLCIIIYTSSLFYDMLCGNVLGNVLTWGMSFSSLVLAIACLPTHEAMTLFGQIKCFVIRLQGCLLSIPLEIGATFLPLTFYYSALLPTDSYTIL